MAKGKNKNQYNNKKSSNKQEKGALAKKEWFKIRAPTGFSSVPFGYTCINETAGTHISTDAIKGRICDIAYEEIREKGAQENDKNQQQNIAWRKIRMQIDEVSGGVCQTSFYGFDITKDKLGQFLKKRQTLIEVYADVKTQDGYLLRVFIITFTRKAEKQTRVNSYAKASQVKLIRKAISDIIVAEAKKYALIDFIKELLGDGIKKKMTAIGSKVYQLQNTTIRKVKVVKRVKSDGDASRNAQQSKKQNE